MKSIAEAYAQMATVEEKINVESRWLDEREKWLTDQILTAPDWKAGQIERAGQLVSFQTLKALWPARQKLQKAEIFALQSQIESQKQR